MEAASSAPTLKLVTGMKAIATHFGINERKAYGLARQNLLPGVFALGRSYFLDPEVARGRCPRSRESGLPQ